MGLHDAVLIVINNIEGGVPTLPFFRKSIKKFMFNQILFKKYLSLEENRYDKLL